MATRIIDLDELVAPPKKVKLDDKVYTLPGELSVPLYLRLKAAEEAQVGVDDDSGRIEELHEMCLELFRKHQPDLEELPVGLVQLFTIIPRVYGPEGQDSGEEEDPNPPTTRARRGSGSTRKTKAKSRSST